MQADEAVGALGRGGQPGNRDRRGIGGDDRIGRQQPVELLKDLDLDRLVLGRGFNHQRQTLEVVITDRSANARQRGIAIGGAHFVLLDQPLEACCHRGQALVDRGLRDVDHHHLDAADCTRLRDTVAHGAGTDDAESVDAHR